MTKLRRAALLSLAALVSCSSERKLSHVETRVPASASVRSESADSLLRARLSDQKKFHVRCTAEVRELASLAAEHVSFPPCPTSLVSSYQAAHEVISLEESGAVEEMIGMQCRLNPRDGFPEAVQNLLQEPERKSADASFALRASLRTALVEAQAQAEPIRQWIRNNGEFVLPEEQLEFFDRVVNHDGCSMPDQEIDQSYRILRNLDELIRIQGEAEPQRLRLERLLAGIHAVMDRKIQEYFRR